LIRKAHHANEPGRQKSCEQCRCKGKDQSQITKWSPACRAVSPAQRTQGVLSIACAARSRRIAGTNIDANLFIARNRARDLIDLHTFRIYLPIYIIYLLYDSEKIINRAVNFLALERRR
jgi:hypothetical protein